MNPKLDPLVKEYCDTKNAAIKEKILKNYQPLIEYIARKLAFNKNDIDDLIQVGSIALIKALDRFKLEKNTEFSTFATPNIIGEIKHYFRDKSKIVKVPRKIQELYSRVKNEIYNAQVNGTQLTIKDIATKLDVDEEKVIEAMEAGQNIKVVSLDAPSYKSDSYGSSNTEPTIIDQIGSSNKEEDTLLNKETLKQAILKLSTRERRIIYLRFYGGLSQAEIADRLELSQMHISRLLSKSIKHLQEELNRN